ncbi:helix-turn-helix transcriptional regulator [Xanthobacter sp. V3C-3]|uniref:helix-turn-helix domain-containing protein n=1 Tax=Xanthobacter lutulentifluminis TaxID=3119935 RepID=UPI003726494E
MKLAEYITEKQTTASRLAGEIGVPVSTITRLIRGERKPGIDLVARIAAATNGAVAAEDFFPQPAPDHKQEAAPAPDMGGCA